MPTTTSAPPARSLTLHDLLRLGQAGQPWDFLPLAAQALEQVPDQHALRFLAAANLARLGLRTPALEQLTLLPPDKDVAALSAAVSRLPSDTAPPPTSLHAGALTLSGIEPASDCFKTLDHNLVTRPRGSTTLRSLRLINETARAQALLDSVRQRNPADLQRILLDGFSAPLFKLLYDATATTPTGIAPRITILQHDPAELLENLAVHDLTKELSDPRVEVFTGDSAAQRLSAALHARAETSLPTIVLPSPTLRARTTPTATDLATAALEHQRALTESLHTKVTARYAPRTTPHWRTRFPHSSPNSAAEVPRLREAEGASPLLPRLCGGGAEALRGGGGDYSSPGSAGEVPRLCEAEGAPLRILIPTTRFSTYIQHAAHDLAATLSRMGHAARVLSEPDPHANFSALGYLRAIDDLDPDLVILINFPRRLMSNVFPPTLPYICWVQDAMPHLFDPDLGRSQTPYDFLAGHTFPDLILKYGYPADRLLPFSIPADDTKFHPGPADPSLTCDVAFISHHAETPEAMLARLTRDLIAPPAVKQALADLWPDIQLAAQEAHHTCHHARLRAAITTRLHRTLGHHPDPRSIDLLLNSAAVPLLDRILRHQTLAWAADICARHGLRLHIHGNNWHTHPTLAPYAKGPLPHADHLRAAYQSARVTLHVSATALTHQRVTECFLSGGLCLTRLHRDAISGLNTTAELALADTPPDHEDGDRVGFTTAAHPALQALADHRARLGYPLDGPVYWTSRQRRTNQAAARTAIAKDCDPSLLLGDLTHTTFTNREQLEALILRAVRDDAWRTATIDRIAATAREHLTTTAFARQLLSLVARSFETAP